MAMASSSGMIVYGGVYLAYQQGEGRDLGEERLFNNKYPWVWSLK